MYYMQNAACSKLATVDCVRVTQPHHLRGWQGKKTVQKSMKIPWLGAERCSNYGDGRVENAEKLGLTNCCLCAAADLYPFFFFYRAWSICPRCTAAYRLIVRPWTPLWFRRSYFQRQVSPRPYDTDPSSEMWNCGRECWLISLPKCRLPRSI
jgi:hypothetical protein